MTHSPLPWRSREDMGAARNIDDPNDDPVVLVQSRSPLGKPDPEAMANVALIVRAVNSHADLLAACKAARGGHKGWHGMVSEAIAKADGK